MEAERLVLARDLHDVLAHTTTVIGMQAHVAREALDDGDLDAVRAALGVISEASGEATRELPPRSRCCANRPTALPARRPAA